MFTHLPIVLHCHNVINFLGRKVAQTENNGLSLWLNANMNGQSVVRIFRIKSNTQITIIFMPQEWNLGLLLFVLSVCLSVANIILNLGHTFWTIRDRDFIFGKHTELMKPFRMTPRPTTLWPWPWRLTYISKKYDLYHNFWTIWGGTFITCAFLVMRPFCSYQIFDLMTLTVTFDLHG